MYYCDQKLVIERSSKLIDPDDPPKITDNRYYAAIFLPVENVSVGLSAARSWRY